MKLNKKIDNEIWQVYDTWLHSYLTGDVKTYDSYLDPAYHFIGSTSNEEFLSREDTTAFFEDTAAQFAGKTELRNESRILEKFGELVFITHVFDAWFLYEKQWTYYGRFRFSSVLHKTKEGWRFIYQHFSMPDSKAQEGETIGYDQISAENLQLREAIKRRTVELEHKNRELEIEASLERIRAQAMAMRESSDLLDIVVTMRTEFVKLGHEAHYFWHMRWLPEKYEKAMTSGDGTRIGMVMELPRHMHGDIPKLTKWEKGKKPTVIYAMDASAAIAYVDKMVALGDFKQVDPNAPSHDDIRHIGGLTFIMARTTHGEIGYSLPGVVEEVPKEDLEILVRFAGAFDLAHKRFEDLKKSEQQAREVQIELALERVRSRTMGMQKSEELKDVVKVIFDQLAHLSINAEHAGIVVDYEPKKDWHFWIAETQDIPAKVTVPYLDLLWDRQFTEAKKKGKDFFTTLMDLEEKNSFYKVLLPHIKELTTKARDFYFSCPGLAISTVIEKDIGIYIENFSGSPYTREENDILRRFAKVFQQTYTRFLDLQKAEAQVREAQIELGLERVRARAMAMQHSEELSELVNSLFQELTLLDFALTFCIINVINEADRSNTVWAADPLTGKDPESYYMKFEDYEFHRGMWDAWKSRKNKWVYTLEGAEKEIYDEYLYRDTEFRRFPSEVQEANRALDRYVCGFTFSNFGGLQTVSAEPISEANLDILARFGKVFDLTYTRFNDLKQAEAQAREAQIEAALERVRARSMAMHKSEELADLSLELVKQVQALGVATWFCAFNIYDDDTKGSLEWGSNGQGTFPKYRTPMEGVFLSYYEAGQKGETLLINEIGEKECPAHYDYLCTLPGVGEQLLKMKDAGIPFPTSQIDHVAYFKYGYVLFITYEPSPESHQIFTRFAKVFEQTYTRFLDLQKAEAQAREAQIENALEKVRSRTMAMQKSHELPEAANNLFLQVQELGIPAWSAGYCIWETEDKKAASCNMSSEGEIQKSFILPTIGEGYNFYDPLKKGESFYIEELGGDALVKHYEFMRTLPKVGEILEELIKAGLSLPTFQIFHILYFPHGYLMFITYEKVPEAHDIFKRFAKVFEQTYTRFLDLQNAEAQARESQIEAALERVRSRTMGMQRSEELGDVATVLFKELNQLVDNLWTCGFVLCEKDRKEDEWWLSDQNGFIPAFYLPNVGDETHANIYNAWKNGADYYTEQLEGEPLQKHYEWLMNIPVAKKIFEDMKASGTEIPTWQKLHCAFFKTGYLVIITQVPCPEEEIFKRFAQVFDLTYTRFLDLQLKEEQALKLAEEKLRLEATLTDLRATQTQLIQSEKMASLGELTAGIAHEIQNPLNFVNNFSEVSNELIDEMNEELEKGDIEEAKAISGDIKQNLEKIHHHGKRADGIVKGMLQHSRSSSGDKEPTNLNALADEYLRLAYHGLRAKDKSFNAALETHFDDKIGKVNVVPQEMGRVILNLITNAFYVVQKKKKEQPEGFQPTVSVSTQKEGNKVQIRVKDNGNGIPDAIKEKIFQPFFTTKPTGEGTGLGLSMSYDIITKGHGGELKVETEEGEGTVFIITLKNV